MTTRWKFILIIAALVGARDSQCQGILVAGHQMHVSLPIEPVPEHKQDKGRIVAGWRIDELTGSLPDPVLPTVPPALNRPHRIKTNGQMEVGGIIGSLPYSMPKGNPLNAYAKGTIGVEFLGVPVQVLVDVGTDLPVRGQRNTVRLAFDAPRLLNKDKWSNANKLHDMKARLDSLEAQRAAQYRRVRGTKARLEAAEMLEAKLAGGSSGIPDLPVVPGQSNLRDTLGLPDQQEHSNPMDTLPIPVLGGSMPEDLGTQPAPTDSLRQVARRAEQRLKSLGEDVEQQRMRVQRLTATVNAKQGKEGIIEKFTRGIKHFDIGSCSPTSSEFLINGINFQGVSFAYQQKGIYFLLDRGKSFDDTWMDTDPVSRRLHRLQQSLFFADARDLNPRRITAVKGGIGEPEGTHVHVGYLNGSRKDQPEGVPLSTGNTAIERNHVVELDLGYAIKKNHVLRVEYARSVIQDQGTDESPVSSKGTAGDLFQMGADKDQAVRVSWTSSFNKNNTRIRVQGKSVSPYFQSFGMGYVRNGAKGIEGKLDQRLGRKLRFRGRYAKEIRKRPLNPRAATTISRIQWRLSYRPFASTTIRAGYLPVQVKSASKDGIEALSTNRMYTIGGDLRKRWRKTVAVLSIDLGAYQWSGMGGMQQQMLNQSVGLTLLRGESWSGRIGWTGLSAFADSTSATSNLSFTGTHQTKRGTRLEVGLELPTDESVGWLLACSRPIGKKVTLGLRGQSVLPIEENFTPDLDRFKNYSYNWAFFTRIAW